MEVVLAGPVSTGAADQSLIFLQSNTAGGSSSAFGVLAYKDTSGTDSWTVAYWDSAGLHIIETLFGSGGVVTIGDAVQLNNSMTITGTLSVNGSPDTSTNGLPNGHAGHVRHGRPDGRHHPRHVRRPVDRDGPHP